MTDYCESSWQPILIFVVSYTAVALFCIISAVMVIRTIMLCCRYVRIGGRTSKLQRSLKHIREDGRINYTKNPLYTHRSLPHGEDCNGYAGMISLCGILWGFSIAFVIIITKADILLQVTILTVYVAVTATITEIRYLGNGCIYIDMKYQVDGEMYQYKDSNYCDWDYHTVGDNMTIYYDPCDVAQSTIGGDYTALLPLIVLLIVSPILSTIVISTAKTRIHELNRKIATTQEFMLLADEYISETCDYDPFGNYGTLSDGEHISESVEISM